MAKIEAYDAAADVLYLCFDPTPKAKYIEDENGDILRFDPETEKLMGFTMIAPRERAEKSLRQALELAKSAARSPEPPKGES